MLANVADSIESIFIIFAGILAFLKYLAWRRSKYLYVTNVQILSHSLWKELSTKLWIRQWGENDHTFRPVIVLPHKLRAYLRVSNGTMVVLEGQSTAGRTVKVTAELFWIPKRLEPWSNTRHPTMSLVLRRFFGIERPAFPGDGQGALEGIWHVVRHHRTHLKPLHKGCPDDPDYMQWDVHPALSYRYYDPVKDDYDEQPSEDNFIEYCGLSIVVRKRTIADYDANLH
jgi:hypothetical protein